MINTNNYTAFESMMDQITINTDDLEIQCNLVKIMPMNNGLVVSGLKNPEPGLDAPIWIFNASMANTVILSNLGSSAPENQFKISNGLDYTLLPGRWVMAIYCGGKYRIEV